MIWPIRREIKRDTHISYNGLSVKEEKSREEGGWVVGGETMRWEKNWLVVQRKKKGS